MNAAQELPRTAIGAVLVGFTILAACGGGYGGGSGSMSCGYNACPPPQASTMTAPVTLSASQVFPTAASTATGTGSVTVNQDSGALSGSVMLSGMTATHVELGDAYAGASGTSIATFSHDASDASRWNVAAGTMLDAQQQADLAAGKLYVLARSANFTGGELRGQLLPAGIEVKFATLTGGAEVPPVASAAGGQIAVTVDTAGLTAAANLTVTGLAATGAMLATGTGGTVGGQLATLNADANDPGHYFDDTITLTATDVDNFKNGLWYGNVSSAAHPGGELRGQLDAPAAAH